LAIHDIFSADDSGEDSQGKQIMEAINGIMVQLVEIGSMVAEFREEVRVHFEEVHEHLNEIEHKNYLYFESLSFQLDSILEQAKVFRRAQHADFVALKSHIEQIGRDLGYDTSSLATLPLFQLYDRAQDIYNQRLEKPTLSRSDIEIVHREILGPLSSWAGSTPHGIFNGLRYETTADRFCS
jgi:hypothetical protein